MGLKKAVYERELLRLQTELVKLQEWTRAEGARLVVVFEGRDAAGKGGTIKRVAEHLNPRVARIAALPTPTERERTQWYFQRYVEHLPAAGEIVLFDRSWYNRAGVEHVMGFCTPAEHQLFLRQCPVFERMLVEDGILLRKYWFSVSDAVQEERFRARAEDPLRRWKLSPMDLESLTRLNRGRRRWCLLPDFQDLGQRAAGRVGACGAVAEAEDHLHVSHGRDRVAGRPAQLRPLQGV
ncbi:polyphosphate kinase 2 [Streptomyces sp. R33]|uniref:ADP/GDP-polyphosphate phosphotransferase n=1 Tax=Streptomyces sp. R33 TaxID=3238629 RepID=A0AB39YF24_9ACTN